MANCTAAPSKKIFSPHRQIDFPRNVCLYTSGILLKDDLPETCKMCTVGNNMYMYHVATAL